MPWDYSIYPELTDNQKRAFTTVGETLYMIQMAEQAIKMCSVYVFNDPDSFSLEKIYSNEERDKKKTLGQLIHQLRDNTDIHPQFDEILKGFVEKRNFFAHAIFNDSNYGLTSDKLCDKTDKFLLDLQDDAWNVQNVFMSCLVNWTKQNGVYEHLPETLKQNSHLKQVEQKPFHLLFKQPPK